MKIQQDLRKRVDAAKKKTHTTSSEKQSFHHLVQSQSLLLEEPNIQQKIDEITVQGDRLLKFRTFRELAAFKRLVKAFMQKVVKGGLDLQLSHSFQLDGGNRQLALIKEVDGKLIELTEEIMHQEIGRAHV